MERLLGIGAMLPSIVASQACVVESFRRVDVAQEADHPGVATVATKADPLDG